MEKISKEEAVRRGIINDLDTLTVEEAERLNIDLSLPENVIHEDTINSIPGD
ncbi:MAG: hypothetical protein JWN37_576 [Candidatus Nomurabacteria bacterium]|nr:hypothetical protein [Candidatus Nomurabacteria bacterium]